jgi:4-hydroxy-tetrahydrodipicolinate synthase
VISGNDMELMPVAAAGGSGLISVLANAFPAVTSEIVQNALKYNFRSARELQIKYLEMTELLFTEGNPAGIKAIMSYTGLCQNNLRLPLMPVSRSLQGRIAKALEQVMK